MSASALLASKPHPTDSEIDDAMSGNGRSCQPSSALPRGGATANPWNSRARSGVRSSNIFRRAICKLRRRRQNRPILRLNPSSCRIESTFNPAGAALNFSDMPTLRPSAFSGLWRATGPDRRHRKLWPADRRFRGIPRDLDGRAGVPLRSYVALAGYVVGFGGAQP
jgi:hypothetical protein